jgi:hypothetical protein
MKLNQNYEKRDEQTRYFELNNYVGGGLMGSGAEREEL